MTIRKEIAVDLNTLKGQKEYYKNVCKDIVKIYNKKNDDFTLLQKAIDKENAYHPYSEFKDNLRESLEEQLPTWFKSNLTIINLGSFTGKWTGHLIPYAKQIICVDIIDDGFWYVQERYKHEDCEFKFYLTQGDELEHIESNSIDFIFSADSLTRTPKNILQKYFIEFSRVTKRSSLLYIHLSTPDDYKNMIEYSIEEVQNLCYANDFEFIDFIPSVFTVGSILVARRI